MISKQKSDFIRSLAFADGHIDPNRVIEAARDPSCIIHDEFDWDIDSAAQKHWVDQAQSLIRFVKLEVIIERQTVIAPYYVPDPLRPPKSRNYLELTIAGRDRAIAQQVLIAELDRIAAAIKRAKEIAAVLGLTDELDTLLGDVHVLRTAAERRREERTAAAAKKRAKKTGRRKPPRRRPDDDDQPRRR